MEQIDTKNKVRSYVRHKTEEERLEAIKIQRLNASRRYYEKNKNKISSKRKEQRKINKKLSQQPVLLEVQQINKNTEIEDSGIKDVPIPIIYDITKYEHCPILLKSGDRKGLPCNRRLSKKRKCPYHGQLS